MLGRGKTNPEVGAHGVGNRYRSRQKGNTRWVSGRADCNDTACNSLFQVLLGSPAMMAWVQQQSEDSM